MPVLCRRQKSNYFCLKWEKGFDWWYKINEMTPIFKNVEILCPGRSGRSFKSTTSSVIPINVARIRLPSFIVENRGLLAASFELTGKGFFFFFVVVENGFDIFGDVVQVMLEHTFSQFVDFVSSFESLLQNFLKILVSVVGVVCTSY